ncbi:MAG: glycosidase, partial [Acidimicrobiales bacterium]
SSIEFRSGTIDADMGVRLDRPGRFAETGRRLSAEFDKGFFETKLGELGALNDLARMVMARLGSRFTILELEAALHAPDEDGVDRVLSVETSHILHWLASSNYRVEFPRETDLAERVIFPSGPTESHGMEDARLVRFVHDDGKVVYYGTYTAFDGHQILPQLVETADFVSFRIATLSGECAQNKGIALFPRMLDGEFVALGRHDNVNNFLMRSPDIRVWRETERIQEPERPWELIQLGNCGSPLETEAGWLVITHGVGPFRRYSLGALLLDLDDPGRVIGHLKEPLLAPRADERDGYVPNVVYSCGSMIVGDHLVLPYGFADVGASIATIELDELLTRLTQ